MALGGRLVQPVFPGGLTPLASAAPLGRRDTYTKFAIWSENPVKARQVCAWLRYQGSQLRNKVQRFKYDMGGAIAPGCFQLVAHSAISGH